MAKIAPQSRESGECRMIYLADIRDRSAPKHRRLLTLPGDDENPLIKLGRDVLGRAGYEKLQAV